MQIKSATNNEDLDNFFIRFGKINSCEVVRIVYKTLENTYLINLTNSGYVLLIKAHFGQQCSY